MDLMDMHGMQFTSSIYDPPMLKRPHFCPHHRSVVRRELFAIDVEAALVFRERHRESRRSFLNSGLSELFAALASEFAVDHGTISANTIAGFGSPSGPVSTQREIRRLAVPADGPVTMASSLPAGGNKTCSALRVRCFGSCRAMGIPSMATISNVCSSSCRST